MAALQKQNYKWIIIASFIGIVIIPGMLPSPMLKNITVGVLGAICVLFEFLSLKNLNSNTDNFKTDYRQMLLLIVLTITLLVINFVV